MDHCRARFETFLGTVFFVGILLFAGLIAISVPREQGINQDPIASLILR